MEYMKLILSTGVMFEVIGNVLCIYGKELVIKEVLIDYIENEKFYVFISECCSRIVNKSTVSLAY